MALLLLDTLSLNGARRNRLATGAVLMLLGVAATWGVLHASPSAAEDGPFAAGMPTQASAAVSEGGPLAALYQRCTLAMLQGTCQVMKPRPASSQASTRVFIAGVGEVDATLYDALRQQGSAMCADVVDACRQDSAGPSCRVAHALYPATP